jgi:hypothetical protein
LQRKTKLMGFLLFLLSIILASVLCVIGFVFSFIQGFILVRWKTGLKKADHTFLILAKSVDKFGNVICEELFNATLITKGSQHQFGKIEQTISMVIGYNLQAGTLSRAGRVLNKILDLFEEDHSIKAIIDP